MSKSKFVLYIFISLFIVSFLQGCKSKKQVADAKVKPENSKEKFEHLEDSLIANKSFPGNLSIKSKVYFKTPKMTDSFKMHIRMKQDSIIWISVTFYKVEVARFLMTPDSVKVLDRKNGKYYLGDYKYIANRFKVPLDFELIQSIFLGNSFKLDSAVKVKAYSSRGNIIVASLNNLWFDNGSGEKLLVKQETQMWIDPETYRVKKSKIGEYNTKKRFTTTYSDTLMINGYSLPNGAEYVLRTEEEMKFTSNYLKVESKPDMRFPFTISSKYEPIF